MQLSMAVASVENPILDKILTFVNDNGYRELMESASRYNTRIRKDRTYRQPYIDSQTGIAQKHCNLFVTSKKRMPGILQGQVYTYPANRWKSKHRSYLASFVQTTRSDPDEHTITTVENPAATANPTPVEEMLTTTDKDSWQYYDEQAYEDDPDDEFDSEQDDDDETYSNKRGSYKKKKGVIKKQKRTMNLGPKKKPPSNRNTPTKVLGPRGGRRPRIMEDENDTTGKPFPCDLCDMRYKTRPGLIYHYRHHHKEGLPPKTIMNSDESPHQAHPVHPAHPDAPGSPHRISKPPISHLTPLGPGPGPGVGHGPGPGPIGPPGPGPVPMMGQEGPPPGVPGYPPSSYWSDASLLPGTGRPLSKRIEINNSNPTQDLPPIPNFPKRNDPPPVSTPPPPPPPVEKPIPPPPVTPPVPKKRVTPSPYCDFCLGNASENKKTGQAEALVSCADCGRSGHPACLQFTENMRKSVMTYRWQCIECKTCTLCGTSENDDRLLFCDDCDRGYHLYCLSPPLQDPPEGEWFCHLCLKEFH